MSQDDSGMRNTVKRLRQEFTQREQGMVPRMLTPREQRKLDKEVSKLVKREEELRAARRAAEQRAEQAERETQAVTESVKATFERRLAEERDRLAAQSAEAVASLRAEFERELNRRLGEERERLAAQSGDAVSSLKAESKRQNEELQQDFQRRIEQLQHGVDRRVATLREELSATRTEEIRAFESINARLAGFEQRHSHSADAARKRLEVAEQRILEELSSIEARFRKEIELVRAELDAEEGGEPEAPVAPDRQPGLQEPTPQPQRRFVPSDRFPQHPGA